MILHCSTEGPGPGPGRLEKGGDQQMLIQDAHTASVLSLLDVPPSPQDTLKHLSNESRLFPALLEFQDGQTFSEELIDEHIPYSWE